MFVVRFKSVNKYFVQPFLYSVRKLVHTLCLQYELTKVSHCVRKSFKISQRWKDAMSRRILINGRYVMEYGDYVTDFHIDFILQTDGLQNY